MEGSNVVGFLGIRSAGAPCGSGMNSHGTRSTGASNGSTLIHRTAAGVATGASAFLLRWLPACDNDAGRHFVTETATILVALSVSLGQAWGGESGNDRLVVIETNPLS